MNRVGTFFLLLGVLICALFLLSDIAGLANMLILLGGGVCIAFGLWIKLSQPRSEPSPSSGRFRIIREIRNPQPRPPKEKKPLFQLKWGKKSKPSVTGKAPEKPAGSGKPAGKPNTPQATPPGKKQEDKGKQAQKK